MPKGIQGIALLILSLCSAVTIVAAPGDGLWQTKVPEADRIRVNPNAGNPNAVAVGAKLFQQHCASCHGTQAQGYLEHPNLHSNRVKGATPGELEWLLKNGSLKNGMPSWSRLPEPQLWQLVSFLKSL